MIFADCILAVSLVIPSAGTAPAESAPPAEWTHRGADASRRGGEGPIPARPTLVWKFKTSGSFLAP
ncbi:MAG: hypothetical protein NTV79_08260, partial [Candidatus Aureabacteria bacterium]|nr:hypothetical protein [Candidatus Auribacterota bacterium]